MPMFGALEVGVESAGVLIAPTGRIAAGDPHLCLNSSPDFPLRFTAEVPAGRYPLELCTVAVEDASGAVIDHATPPHDFASATRRSRSGRWA